MLPRFFRYLFSDRIILMAKNWSNVIAPQAILSKKFDRQVLEFLSLPGNMRILYWLDDSYSLLEVKMARNSLGGQDQYYDYSFMITPAFKALELWIINVAPALGVQPELIDKAKEKGQFNSFLSDDAIQNLADAVIAKLEDRAKSEKAIRAALNSLSSYLSTLRHTPAHCGETIDNPEQADTYFNEILSAINRITRLLLDNKVIDFKNPTTGMPRPDTVWTKI